MYTVQMYTKNLFVYMFFLFCIQDKIIYINQFKKGK